METIHPFMAKADHVIVSTRKSAIIGTLAGWLMWLFGKTLRVRIHNDAGFDPKDDINTPVILAMWHNRIFALTPVWKKVCGHRPCKILTSASKDGETVARALQVFGVGAARGSSSRRGAAALIELRRTLRDGIDVAITPDGPKGPVYKVQPGVVKLAESAGVPLVPMHCRLGSAWRLKTWDRFAIPKPFSTLEVTFAKPVHFEKGMSPEEFEEALQKLEAVLVEGLGED